MKTKIALISFLVNSITIRSLSSYLKKNGVDVYCYFIDSKIDQVNLESLLSHLKSKEIDLVGISFVTDDYLGAVVLTDKIKERLSLPVIWGGPHVNVRPAECLKHADAVCLGEGEEPLLDLAVDYSRSKKLNTTIKNFWFKIDGGIIRNEIGPLVEDLDKYPFPDFDLNSQYILAGKGIKPFKEFDLKGKYSLMTSRGCPYKCSYCYNNYRWAQYKGKGKYLRFRSVENVIEELIRAKLIFPDLKAIDVWDDSFLARTKEEIKSFSEKYASQIGLPFFALIEPMAFDREKIEILKKAGLEKLQVGVQTGSERVNRDIYKRRATREQVVKIAKYLDELGIKTVYDFIFNNPYENSEDLKETISLLAEFPSNIEIQGYNLIFYPGTEITDQALKDGYISKKNDAGEDYSPIESAKESPVAMRGKADVSGRFYNIEYDYAKNEYLNTIISLFALPNLPRGMIKMFANAGIFGKLSLRLFMMSYPVLRLIKKAVKSQ